MANIETLLADTRYWVETAAPSTPASGSAVTYWKTDGKFYGKNDAGTEYDLTASGGSTPVTAPGTWIGVPVVGHTTVTANRAHYMRVTVPFTFTPTRLCTYIFASSGNLDLGVYNDDGTGLNPGTKIVTLGSTASPGTGIRRFTATVGALSPGCYWLALAADNTSIDFGYIGVGTTTNGGGGAFYGLIEAAAFPLPATAGAGLSPITHAMSAWMEIA